MSGSSGPTTTQTSGIDPSLSPYLSQFGSMVSNYANTPYQQYQGTQVAPLAPIQSQAISGLQGLMGAATPALGTASSYLTNLLSTNPQTDPNTQAMMAAADRQTTNAYNDATQGITGRFNTTGNFGGVRDTMAQDRANTDLATGLANGDAAIQDQAYQAALGRQMAAIPELGGLLGSATSGLTSALGAGGVQQQYGQNLATAQQGNFQNYVNYPSTQIGNISGWLGSLLGATPHTTTTQGPAPDPLSQGLGLALVGSRLGGSSGSNKLS